MIRGAVVVAVLLSVLASAAPAPGDEGRRELLIGVADDTAKWRDRPDRLLATYRHLGLDAVRLTIPWQRGQSKPTKEAGIYLHRAAQMVARGQRVVLAIYGQPRQAPLDRVQRAHYCGFLRHITSRLPIRDLVVWNEVNSPQFWPQEAGAAGYEALLATCWDALRRVRPAVNLISTTAAHCDPAGFVRAMGEAYRASGRKRPILTTFGHNPYPDNASEPPSVQHADAGTVSQGDLPRLLQAIDVAFEGTGQPVPGEGSTFVWYLENGFQTTVPPQKRSLYSGRETDFWTLAAVAPRRAPPGTRDQATQLRDAVQLAYCQPQVGAYFNFQLIDESRLAGWQSGLLWRDGTRKPSYQAFRAIVEAVATGDVDCENIPGAGSAPVRLPPAGSDKPG